MFIIDWVASLSTAQRDAIRTVSIVIGSGCIPVFGFVLTWLIRIIRKQTRQTVEQTQAADWKDGSLNTVSVADLARRIMHNTQEFKNEFRSEITDLVNDPRTAPVARVHGRRRNTPTNPVSIYEGEPDNE